MSAYHDSPRSGSIDTHYPARRAHLVSRYAQSLRIMHASGTAGARRREMYPVFHPRAGHRPLARRRDSSYRLAASALPANRRDGLQRTYRTAVQQCRRALRPREREREIQTVASF